MRLVFDCTTVGALILAFSSPASGQLSFEGLATNLGYPNQPSEPQSARVQLTVGERHSDAGQLLIGSPLGGSGRVTFYRWADSVLFISVSGTADTITWLGRHAHSQLAGIYHVAGGRSAGQWGEWSLKQTAGTPFVALARGPRPVPDSVDLMEAFFSSVRDSRLTPETRTSVRPGDIAPSEDGAASTRPVRFTPGQASFSIGIGAFGPCERAFDTTTKVASLFCPKQGSPQEREYIYINFYLPGVWDGGGSAGAVAGEIRNNSAPGLITESAFQTPSSRDGSATVFHIVQTYASPSDATGNVYLVTVEQLGGAAVAVSYGRRFDLPRARLRGATRDWLSENVLFYSSELGRLHVDAAWVAEMRALASP